MWRFAAVILIIAAGALAFRLPMLDLRPMHVDESVNAVKFRDLYEKHTYAYDPTQFHGPSLYYMILPFAWTNSSHQWVDFDANMYRRLPIACGVALILMLLLVGDALGKPACIAAAVLTAVSPAMVFYSRYLIHEMALVLFTFGAIASAWRYIQGRKTGWAIACGAMIGLMFATKETTLIIGFAAVVALGLSLAWARWQDKTPIALRPYFGPVAIAGALGAGLVVAVLLFSAFFTHCRGLIDALRIFSVYFHRAGESVHVHEWDYYLKILLFTKVGPVFVMNKAGQLVNIGVVWTEASIVILAVIGAIATLEGRGVDRRHLPLARFLVFFTIILTAIYCMIPYKTPWNMLGFLHGMILLAGVGAAVLARLVSSIIARTAVVVGSLVLCSPLAFLAYRATLVERFASSNNNPYVYGQTVPDVNRLADTMERLAAVHPEGHRMLVDVVDTYNYWPLPWYLRRFERVYFEDDLSRLPAHLGAPVVMAALNMNGANNVPSAVRARLNDPDKNYQTIQYGLRHDVIMVIYIEKSLWERYMAEKSRKAPAMRGPSTKPTSRGGD